MHDVTELSVVRKMSYILESETALPPDQIAMLKQDWLDNPPPMVGAHPEDSRPIGQGWLPPGWHFCQKGHPSGSADAALLNTQKRRRRSPGQAKTSEITVSCRILREMCQDIRLFRQNDLSLFVRNGTLLRVSPQLALPGFFRRLTRLSFPALILLCGFAWLT